MPPRVPKVSVYYRKNRGSWHVRWREHGQSRESGAHSSRDEAEAAAHKLREQLRRELPGVRSPDSLTGLVAEWWDSYAATELSTGTRYTYKASTNRILASLSGYSLRDLSTPLIDRWHKSLREDGHSPRTANATLTALSSILQRGVEWGYLSSNPARGVRRFPEPRKPVVIPTRDDVARLGMTAPNDQARAMLLVAAYAGLRQGELRFVQPRHLLPGNRILVEGAIGANGRPKTTKTNDYRVVPVPAQVFEWITAYASGIEGYLFAAEQGGALNIGRWHGRVWYPWQQAAGVQLEWRHLRHYYASQLAAVGATIQQASRWMGHKSIQTTVDKYMFLFDEDEADVMSRLAHR